MKARTLEFSAHRLQYNSWQDDAFVYCPYTIEGTNERTELVVRVAFLVYRAWQLKDEDLVKVAFAHGKSRLINAYQTGRTVTGRFEVAIEGQENIRLPFDAMQIQQLPLPNGQTATVSEPMGFIPALP